jgi:DHA2 family multidrug resistance protein-like MFS transporter
MLLIVFADGPWALWVLVAGMVVVSLGMAPVFAIGTEQIITSAPPERAGAASSVAETASEFSGALGIALFGSAGTLIYRHQLNQAGLTAVPPEAMATLGGALQAAAKMSPTAAQALEGAAQAAFTDALQVTALVASVLVLLASVMAARMQKLPS